MAFSTKIIIIHVILMTFLTVKVLSRPGAQFEWNKPDKCTKDESVLETCQRCAKHTKSNIVYPMCCQDLEDAYTWCDKYISYGKSYP